ncbi:MAG TPA: SUF system NifU family Fe-S cluster assembly protein [Thermoanaerobaculia bacterium]|nr:SUF system NifU family Fe-S cluster assembly protein [Thermoanaerobaculia bacterium]
MSDLRELYQQVILDHNKNPRNFREMADATSRVEGYNPLCGDHYTIFLKTAGDKIDEVSFTGSGCAISKASASVMSSTVKGKSRDEAEQLFDTFHRLVTGDQSGLDAAELGRLAAFSGVSEFPARVKCATLAWHTLRNALEGKDDKVSTE